MLTIITDSVEKQPAINFIRFHLAFFYFIFLFIYKLIIYLNEWTIILGMVKIICLLSSQFLVYAPGLNSPSCACFYNTVIIQSSFNS